MDQAPGKTRRSAEFESGTPMGDKVDGADVRLPSITSDQSGGQGKLFGAKSMLRTLRLAFRFSLREMRSGLSGFLIFLACIALGVAAIGGVNSVAQAISAGVANEGQVLLGGDIRFELNQREATGQELAFLRSLGGLATSASMRSMARLEDGSDQSLAEVKAVDGAYPLYGALQTDPPMSQTQLFGVHEGIFGAAAPDLLFERLGLKPGDRIRLGSAIFQLRARIVTEPDAVSDGFGFAPRLMVSLDGLRATGLIQLGSLVEFAYKVRLADGASDAELVAVRETAKSQFPQAGWSIRTRSNAAPSLSSNIERFSQFLTLVGLTALVVGGVGVANAVRAYLDGKRAVIATFKSLGASGGFVFTVYLVQILLIAGLGILAGLVFGAAMPFAAKAALQSLIPVPAETALYPGVLATAALFGLLVTLAFALFPLGRSRDVPATALFREMGFEGRGFPGPAYVVSALTIAAILALLAILLSDDRWIASIFVAATIVSFIVLRSVGWLVQWVAKKSPRVRSTALRLAIGNIHRPGALTPSVVLSLGLGLTLLVTLALIDGNLRRHIMDGLPEKAPNFFFVDIQNAEVEDFAQLLAKQAPGGTLMRVPMLRGRVMALNGIDVQKITAPAGGAWVLRGDRGITYSETVPENATLSAGKWWPRDYSGEPLVSFSAEEAVELGLKLGDTVTVNVLGRDITARIANLRQVEWESMGINFVMVFSPNAFAGAPHSWLATLTMPSRDPNGRIPNSQCCDAGLSRGHDRSREGRARRGQSPRWPAGHGDPCGRERGAHRFGAGAFRSARRGQSCAHPRCGGAEDARRDAEDADRGLFARIHADRVGDSDFRASGREHRSMVRRGADNDAADHVSAGSGRSDDRPGPGVNRWLRACRHLADPRSQGCAGAQEPLSALC